MWTPTTTKALSFACSLALAYPQVLSAAAANDLVCTGCVQTSDLANSAVTSAKLGANSVDGNKIKNGSVGTADLAAGSVDSNKIKNGSIAEVDLNAALLARLAAMETRLTALEGGTYSNATFKGTYRCLALGAEEYGLGHDGTDGGYAGVSFDSGAYVLTADGAGSGTSEGSWTDFERSWYVNWYPTDSGGYHALGAWERLELNEPDEPGTFTYAVSADGQIHTGDPTEEDEIWISRSGDTVILRWQGDTYPGGDETEPRHGYEAGLDVCVRTAQ